MGTVVVEVLADDEDYGTNAQVRYKLKNLSNNHWRSFSIDETTGVITLRSPLDRETQKVYELRVEASDQVRFHSSVHFEGYIIYFIINMPPHHKGDVIVLDSTNIHFAHREHQLH